MQPAITLTTDFGEREANAAILKGELLQGCPGAQLVDLSHQIARADVLDCALFLAGAVPAFPRGTVHLVNVAPGPVSVAVEVGGHRVVCPDNGVLTVLLDALGAEPDHVVELTLPGAGETGGQAFFGRDVLAPAAARLASGVGIAELGGSRPGLRRIDLPRPEGTPGGGGVEGEVIAINRFGNLVTNIGRSQLGGREAEGVQVGHFPIGAISQSFGDVPPGSPLAIFGISGLLEIAHNGDRADQRLGLGKGIRVRVSLK